MSEIYLSNAQGRKATLKLSVLQPPASPRPGLPGHELNFTRYLASTEEGLHEALQARYGEEYAQALLDGDPEIDMEVVGQRVESTHVVYLSSRAQTLYAPPSLKEVLIAPDGTEKLRREPEDVEGNIDEEHPLRWTGRKFKLSDLVQRFVFRRSFQIIHRDPLSYDYLFAMAQELDEEQVAVMLGAGDGRKPLIFQQNGSPYRGFLEGRVEGRSYQLLLHLSNMELKRPE